MGFRDLDIKIEYSTLVDEIAESFYIPVLKEAVSYKRAVGFFSSTVLLQLTKGLGSFIKHNGKMKLIISPRLDEKDYAAIEKGYALKKQLEDKIVSSFDEFVEFEQKEDRFGMLSYMISSGILEIKIVALEKDNDKAMFHEKFGILEDLNDDCISFSGGVNDSNTAINMNYDGIDVYCAWKSSDSEERCISKNMRFKRMWNGTEKGLVTIPFPDIIKNKLMKYEKKDVDYVAIDEEFIKNYNLKKMTPVKHLPTLEKIEGLRKYQLDAIDSWAAHNYRGIFDMATGTGKTFTGCGAIERLFKDKKRVFVIICCPYIHLVDQWCEEVLNFDIQPIKCYGGLDYKVPLERAIRKFKHRKSDFECVIVVNRTFQSEYFQQQILVNLANTLLVVDEAHNFGSFKLQKCLEFDYPYRLALSATLERYGDPVGTKALYNFFGEKNIEYSLEQAINQGMLTPYKYHPVIVSLNNEELEKYIDLTKKIGKVLQGNKDSDYLKRLLIMRARLIASAVNKIGALKELLENYLEDNNMLIYCGAVKYEDEEFDDGSSDKKQIKLVVDMLNNNLKIKALKFTSEEKTDERKSIIAAFKDNIIQALVAIKCLDEGMNIPAIRTAFILASSTNPKEYIQRRGRVLRKYPGKKYADIYDFITLPFSLEDAPHVSYEKMKYVNGLVKRELTRFLDFANLAMNTSECNSIFDDIKSTYDLDIINIDEEVDLYE